MVALTGGIGSGKTTVSDRFAALGVPVIDADLVARTQVTAGSDALSEIVATFGGGVLTADGELDRAALRETIFGDDTARRQLEGILHPRIRAEMQRQVTQASGPYVLVVVPLLLETRQTDLAERILVVDLPEGEQLARASARDGQTTSQIKAIMASQCDRQCRLSAADDIIDNSGSPDALQSQVERMHQYYMSLARNRKN